MVIWKEQTVKYDDIVIEVSEAKLERTADKHWLGQHKVRALHSPVGEMNPEEAFSVEYDNNIAYGVTLLDTPGGSLIPVSSYNKKRQFILKFVASDAG